MALASIGRRRTGKVIRSIDPNNMPPNLKLKPGQILQVEYSFPVRWIPDSWLSSIARARSGIEQIPGAEVVFISEPYEVENGKAILIQVGVNRGGGLALPVIAVGIASVVSLGLGLLVGGKIEDMKVLADSVADAVEETRKTVSWIVAGVVAYFIYQAYRDFNRN